MPAPPIPAIKVSMEFAGPGGSDPMLTFCCTTAGGPPYTLPELQDAAAAFSDWWDGNAPFAASGGLKAVVSDQFTLERVVARDAFTVGGLAWENAPGTTGTVVGDLLPTEVALCVSLRTGLVGRSFRGRSYLFGATVAANDDGRPEATYIANVLQAYNELINDLPTSGSSALLLSVGSATLPAATPIVGCTIDTQWDTQRRRGFTV